MRGIRTPYLVYKQHRLQTALLMGLPTPECTPKDFAALGPAKQLEFRIIAAKERIDVLLPLVESHLTDGWKVPSLAGEATAPENDAAAEPAPDAKVIPMSTLMNVCAAAIEYLECVLDSSSTPDIKEPLQLDRDVLSRFLKVLPETKLGAEDVSLRDKVAELRTLLSGIKKRFRTDKKPGSGAPQADTTETVETAAAASDQAPDALPDKLPRKERKPRAKKSETTADVVEVVVVADGEEPVQPNSTAAPAKPPRKPRAKKAPADVTVTDVDAPPAVIDVDAPPQEKRKRRDATATAATNPAGLDEPAVAVAAAPANAPTKARTLPPLTFINRAPPALTPAEKAACAALRDAIRELGVEVALETNAIPNVMAAVKAKLQPLLSDATAAAAAAAAVAAATATAEAPQVSPVDQSSPSPSQGAAAAQPASPLTLPPFVAPIQAVIDKANATIARFNADQDLQTDFDEDLLHDVAHCCLTALNDIEGYRTPPAPKMTQAQLEKKLKDRAARREKREAEEAARQLKAKEKEEAVAKKLQEADKKRSRAAEAKEALALATTASKAVDSAIEDTKVSKPRPLGYVAYDALPFDDPADYEMALRIWTFITSLPSTLQIEQMPFSLFVQVINDENDNEIVDDLVRGMLGAIRDSGVKVSDSAGSPRNVTTRSSGNSIDQLKEFILYASGAKARKKAEMERKRLEKLRKEQEAAAAAAEEDEEEVSSEDGSDDDDDDSSESSDEETSSSSDDSSDDDDDDEDSDDEDESDDGGRRNGRRGGGRVVTRGRAAAKSARGAKKKQSPAQKRGAAKKGNVAAASKKRGAKASPKAGKKRGRGGDDSSDSSDSDAADASDEEQEAAQIVALKEVPEVEPEAGSFEAMLKETMANIAALRSMATWVNIEVHDRLVMFMFLAQQCAQCKVVVDAAARLAVQLEIDESNFEKKLRELQDKAKEALKAIPKTAEDAVEQRKAVAETLTKGILKARFEHVALADTDDHGARIRPLGMDRYKRLYWRFPKDSRIAVQTTPDTDPSFPIIDTPPPLANSDGSPATVQRKMLIDDEDDAPQQKQQPRGAAPSANGAADRQRLWGFIVPERLPAFIDSLEPRGRREAQLKQRLETLLPYLEKLRQGEQGHRMTRSRNKNGGYSNRYRHI